MTSQSMLPPGSARKPKQLQPLSFRKGGKPSIDDLLNQEADLRDQTAKADELREDKPDVNE